MTKRKKSTSKPSVKIYTTTTCPWCQKTKEFLKENKIKYQEINIADNEKAKKEMIKKSGQMGVPVIDINGVIIVGYDPDALKGALEIT
tara:strand:+ start:212 stop:475 length:264 start_codon:yes stop_codon:yes gene_type:complete